MQITSRALFTGTNGTNLSAYTSDTGGTWAHPSYSTGADNFINGNALTKDSSSLQALYYESTGQPADCWNRQVITVLSVDTGQRARLVLRLDTASENYYVFQYSFATNLWGLFANNNGTFSAALGTTYSETLSVSDVRTMEFRISGPVLEGYVNGVLRCVASDSSITAAGKSGLSIAGAGSPTTNVSIDNYESGPLITEGVSIFRGRNFPFFDDEEVNRFEFWPAVTEGADVTLALTGVTATASAGSLTPSRSVALIGQTATSSIGTLGPNLSVSVAGNSATASAGSVTPGLTVGLTGSTGTSSIGTLAPSLTVSISGNQATSAVGTVTPIIGVTVALTGVSATTSVGSLGSSRTTALTGVSASSSVGTVTPSIGVNVALTGVQATTSVGILSPSTSRGLTGNSATALVGTVIADRSVEIVGVTSTATVGSLGTGRTVSITGVGAVADVGLLSVASDDALAVSKNVGSAVLFTTHVGTGVLRTSDVGTMTITTSNVGAMSIVYQDVRTDT